jgi:hypothetical protein
MSAIDLSKIDDVAESVSNLGDWLTDNLAIHEEDIEEARENVYEYFSSFMPTDYVDAYDLATQLNQTIMNSTLQHLCEMLQGNITSAVIAEWHRNDGNGSHGLSLFFPDQANEYSPQYEEDMLDMSTTYAWDDFLKAYHGIE